MSEYRLVAFGDLHLICKLCKCNKRHDTVVYETADGHVVTDILLSLQHFFRSVPNITDICPFYKFYEPAALEIDNICGMLHCIPSMSIRDSFNVENGTVVQVKKSYKVFTLYGNISYTLTKNIISFSGCRSIQDARELRTLVLKDTEEQNPLQLTMIVLTGSLAKYIQVSHSAFLERMVTCAFKKEIQVMQRADDVCNVVQLDITRLSDAIRKCVSYGIQISPNTNEHTKFLDARSTRCNIQVTKKGSITTRFCWHTPIQSSPDVFEAVKETAAFLALVVRCLC
jgi:hypothetical protein